MVNFFGCSEDKMSQVFSLPGIDSMQEFMIIIVQDEYDILVKDSGLGVVQSCLKIQVFLCTRN